MDKKKKTLKKKKKMNIYDVFKEDQPTKPQPKKKAKNAPKIPKSSNNRQKLTKIKKEKYRNTILNLTKQNSEHNELVFQKFIPKRLLILILSHLEGIELLQTLRVCKLWRDTGKQINIF